MIYSKDGLRDINTAMKSKMNLFEKKNKIDRKIFYAHFKVDYTLFNWTCAKVISGKHFYKFINGRKRFPSDEDPQIFYYFLYVLYFIASYNILFLI